MIVINYADVQRILLEKCKNKFLLIEGKSGSGKTKLAISKYKHMINEEKIPSESILVFYANRYQNLLWSKHMDFKTIGEIKKYSYFNFVRRELITYWPLVVKDCKKINNNIIRPVFVEYDTSLYMMEMLVDYFRKSKGYFADIISTSKKIAENILFNINKSAISLVNLNEIGNRIYNSIEVKESVQKKTYEQIDKVINHYINSYLNAGVIDYGMIFYLYNKYLLKNQFYKNHIKNLKYIIVDDFDEISPSQLQLINLIAENAEGVYLFSNPQGYFNIFNGANKEYIKNNIKFKFNCISLNENFLSCQNYIEFAEVITSRIINKTSEDLKSSVQAQIDISSQLRSEMIYKIIERVKDLIFNKGKSPEDIVIISPIEDFVLNYEISNKLDLEHIDVISTSKKTRLIDNPYVNALIVIVCFCKEFKNIKLTEDNLKRFFNLVLDIDPIRSSILSKYIENKNSISALPEYIKEILGNESLEKYNYLKDFIKNYRDLCKERDIPVDELFRRVFLELLIKLPGAMENIAVFQNLNELAEKFIGILVNFKTMKQPEEKFIDFIKNEAKDFYSYKEIEKIYDNKYAVKITNPNTFLNSNFKSKIQIWTDINSDMWAPRNIKELTNAYVLNPNWHINSVYTNEIENKNRQEKLVSIVNCLLRKCEDELYIYGSRYSINGYQQESAFSNTIFDILNESGEY
ncbi:hypothetical protein CLOACE_05910 [Clostridium acetireducens DSM 10703]|uniref:UvrD-like helicase ATP-binding domain-containing protein n=1 Tax=Clostridium acetireducens DSM 10703 TaxID=1121290 RepID=A0A1E8F0R0_9CLOT|nr:UvrD-helicase domain-containing protein [Clostridium acetireducens]OFI07005.1 hypothetical protein CLOACE_05910 [Clostridium acetireducens DSM 10703]